MLRTGEVSTTSFAGPTERVGENPGDEVEVSNDEIQTIKKTLNDTHITTQFHGIVSLRASSPIWASKAIRARRASERRSRVGPSRFRVSYRVPLAGLLFTISR